MKSHQRPITSHQSPATNPQKGFALVAIIFVVLVIFSIALVSGAVNFEYSPDPTGKPTPSTSPTATPSAGTVPTATPDPSAGWSISFSHTPSDCIQETTPVLRGALTASGNSNGYVLVEVLVGGSPQTILTAAFTAPQMTADLNLSSKDGFSTNPWRLTLYEGGTQSGGRFSGGVQQAVYDGTPTGCT